MLNSTLERVIKHGENYYNLRIYGEEGYVFTRNLFLLDR